MIFHLLLVMTVYFHFLVKQLVFFGFDAFYFRTIFVRLMVLVRLSSFLRVVLKKVSGLRGPIDVQMKSK